MRVTNFVVKHVKSAGSTFITFIKELASSVSLLLPFRPKGGGKNIKSLRNLTRSSNYEMQLPDFVALQWTGAARTPGMFVSAGAEIGYELVFDFTTLEMGFLVSHGINLAVSTQLANFAALSASLGFAYGWGGHHLYLSIC